MSADPSASLAFGVDLGEEEPEFLAELDCDLDEWIASDPVRADLLEAVTYFWCDHWILALKGCVHHSDYGSLATEIASFEVDAERLRRFRAELDAVGLGDKKPMWLLTFDNG